MRDDPMPHGEYVDSNNDEFYGSAPARVSLGNYLLSHLTRDFLVFLVSIGNAAVGVAALRKVFFSEEKKQKTS